jgi:hypothetical protein
MMMMIHDDGDGDGDVDEGGWYSSRESKVVRTAAGGHESNSKRNDAMCRPPNMSTCIYYMTT